MRLTWALAGLLAAVLVTYSNHFDNGFHFDDYHTIVRNPAIRTLNLSRFWSDASALSVAPTNQAYRPLLVTSLALDYRLGGLQPFWFHVSAFFWYLVLLVLLFLLCDSIFEGAHGRTLLATAIFGLHPACAETVNYIVQVADLYVALGIVAGLVIYARFPGWRRFGLYLIPPAVALMAKATAAIFAPILLAYIVLFDAGRKRSLTRLALRAVPAFAVSAGGLYFLHVMTASTFVPALIPYSPRWYVLTQPYVALRYFRSFFFPLYLSGDTDLMPFDSIWRPGALAGFAFLALVVAAAVVAARSRAWRPVSFGLWWFLLGLVPTSVYPLGELENDHRMFLPFIGLSIAVAGTAGLLLPLKGVGPVRRYSAAAVSLLAIAALAFEAHQRNEVWRNDESFWSDVAAKSPNDSRGLVNYGFALTKAGKPEQAWAVLQRALAMAPNDSMVRAVLALAADALHHGDAEIQSYYKTAISMSPGEAQVYNYYAKWLGARGRMLESQELYEHAAYLSPTDLESRYALLTIYSERKDWKSLSQTAYGLLDLVPDDPAARRSLTLAANGQKRLDEAERAARERPTADNYAALAAVYEEDGQYAEAVQAAKKALELRPGMAEAARILAEAESRRSGK